MIIIMSELRMLVVTGIIYVLYYVSMTLWAKLSRACMNDKIFYCEQKQIDLQMYNRNNVYMYNIL